LRPQAGDDAGRRTQPPTHGVGSSGARPASGAATGWLWTGTETRDPVYVDGMDGLASLL
jgi:hypothetical protein